MKGVYISVYIEMEIQDFKSRKHNTMDALTHVSSLNSIITSWQDAECAADNKLSVRGGTMFDLPTTTDVTFGIHGG